MYLKAIKYKDVYLAPGSECYALYQEGKMVALDKLLKEILAAQIKLEGRK